MTPKAILESALRHCPPLFRLASRLYHKMSGTFRPLSSGAPEAIWRGFEMAKDLNPHNPGDYYEFGLFGGYTFWVAQQACQQLNILDTNFYGFDSFRGLPPIEGIDKTDNLFFEGQFACSKAELVKNLNKKGIDWSRTEVIEGFFSESLTEDLKKRLGLKEVGVAFIDCDLYSSTKDVLNWLNSLLKDRSILIFDDWCAFGENSGLGQERAFREFLHDNPQLSAEPLWKLKDEISPFAFPVLLPSQVSRKNLMKHYVKNKIEVRLLFSGNLMNHPAYQNKKEYWEDAEIDHEGHPTSNLIRDKVLLLGVSQILCEKQIDKIIDITNKFFTK